MDEVPNVVTFGCILKVYGTGCKKMPLHLERGPSTANVQNSSPWLSRLCQSFLCCQILWRCKQRSLHLGEKSLYNICFNNMLALPLLSIYIWREVVGLPLLGTPFRISSASEQFLVEAITKVAIVPKIIYGFLKSLSNNLIVNLVPLSWQHSLCFHESTTYGLQSTAKHIISPLS